MKPALLFGAILLVTSSGSFAADVVHLNCSLAGSDGGSLAHLSMTLNEATGTATYTVRETGKVFKENAAFTPDIVALGDPQMLKVIDRKTLEIKDGMMLGGNLRVFRSGTCKIAPSDGRQF